MLVRKARPEHRVITVTAFHKRGSGINTRSRLIDSAFHLHDIDVMRGCSNKVVVELL